MKILQLNLTKCKGGAYEVNIKLRKQKCVITFFMLKIVSQNIG